MLMQKSGIWLKSGAIWWSKKACGLGMQLPSEETLGMLSLWIVGWIPFIGFLLKGVAFLIGFGSVLVTTFSAIRRETNYLQKA
jgi:hypothetical protein